MKEREKVESGRWIVFCNKCSEVLTITEHLKEAKESAIDHVSKKDHRCYLSKHFY